MNTNNIFSDYRKAIDKRLAEFLSGQTERSGYSADKSKYPYSLYDPVNYIMSIGGKRIRPVLTMLSCEVSGGNAYDALNAAAAMEILHNFTLVHDDIMDNADTRRGKETLHKKWSVNSAILAGDELIGLSYRSLLSSDTPGIAEAVKAFTDGVIEVCEGQAMDKEFEISDDVEPDEYFVMIKKKTAALIKTSAVIGAIIGNADQKGIENIAGYAENLGIAFQLRDDLLDVTADEAEFGKKIGGDILEKKKTYLYLKSMELLKGPEKDNFRLLYNSGDKSQEKADKVISIYSALRVLDSAKNEIKKYTASANESIKYFENIEFQSRLKSFSEMLLTRNF